MAEEISTTVELNTKNLDKLAKALTRKAMKIRIGIFSQNAARTNNGSSKQTATNATIGAYHEFGTSKLPVRSFLRMPITEKMGETLESSGALDENVLKEVVAQGTIEPWLKKIAIMAEGIVAEAFDTGGFGKWPPSNMDHKTNAQTLVETQQLRNAVTTDIKD